MAPLAMPGAVTSVPITRSARARRQELGRGSALPELERRTQHGRDLVGELLERHAVAALPQVDSAIELRSRAAARPPRSRAVCGTRQRGSTMMPSPASTAASRLAILREVNTKSHSRPTRLSAFTAV